MASVAILIPTYGRVDRLKAVVENAWHPDANVYLIVEPDEHKAACREFHYGSAWVITRPEGFGNYAAAVNHAYRHTAEPYLFTGADDLNFHDGWLETAMERMTDDVAVVGTNDLGNPEVLAGDHATHCLVDRAYLDDPGGLYDEGPGSFMPDVYDHNWTDREFIEVAKLRGVWTPCLESVVEHNHVCWGKAAMDETYQKSFRGEQTDRAIYEQRLTEIHRRHADGTL